MGFTPIELEAMRKEESKVRVNQSLEGKNPQAVEEIKKLLKGTETEVQVLLNDWQLAALKQQHSELIFFIKGERKTPAYYHCYKVIRRGSHR